MTDHRLSGGRAGMVAPLRKVVAEHVLLTLARDVLRHASDQAPGNAPVARSDVIRLERALAAPYGFSLQTILSEWQADAVPPHQALRDCLGPASGRLLARQARSGLSAAEAIGAAIRICGVLRHLSAAAPSDAVTLMPAPGQPPDEEGDRIERAIRDAGWVVARDPDPQGVVVFLRTGRGKDRTAELLARVVRFSLQYTCMEIALLDPQPRHRPDPVVATGLIWHAPTEADLLIRLARWRDCRGEPPRPY